MENMQPGQVIVPHNADEPKAQADGAPEPDRPTEQPSPMPAPTPAPAPEPATPQAPSVAATDEPGEWQFRQEASTPESQLLPTDISWTAAEFIEHQKSAGWYGALTVAGLAAAALDYFITKDKFSTGIIILAAIAFGAFAGRKPHTQQYSVSNQGVQIGAKAYGFQDFRTFSVAEEGATVSIVFSPLKRFMPPLTIYVAQDMEDKVVDFLSACLPFEQHKSDAVDSLLRRIHF